MAAALGAVALALTWATGDTSLLFGVGAVTVGLSLVELIWQFRNAPVTLTPSAVIIRPVVLRRREVAWESIASWVVWKDFLGIRTVAGETIEVALRQLQPEARARLLERLGSVTLPNGVPNPVTAASLRRGHRKNTAWVIGGGLLAGAIGLALMLFSLPSGVMQ